MTDLGPQRSTTGKLGPLSLVLAHSDILHRRMTKHRNFARNAGVRQSTALREIIQCFDGLAAGTKDSFSRVAVLAFCGRVALCGA
jgi:hypothetical protein